MKKTTLLLGLTLSALTGAKAEIWMPSIFGDSMVLQRDEPILLHGEAKPFAKVQAILSGETPQSTKAGDNGLWKITLPAHDATAHAHTLTVVSDSDAKVFSDVAFGEVWLASGQSNMAWPVQKTEDAEEVTAAAQFPQIRFAEVKSGFSKNVAKDVRTYWEAISPGTVQSKSAVAFAFARRLHEELDVPIGIIQSAVGGTRVEAWTPDIMPEMSDEAWAKTAKKQHIPSSLYNGKLNGLVPYTLRGAIWYQGESNHSENDYTGKLERMVLSWREKWGTEFPFYFVQIMPFKYGKEDKEILPRFWVQNSEAERRIPNSAMLVSSDTTDLTDIHPPKKTTVGNRLASIALHRDYNRTELPSSGPRFAKLERTETGIRVHFDHAKGLKTNNGSTPDHWEVRTAEGTWAPAEAEITGETLHIKAQGGTAIRFAWDKLAMPNLVNSAGWPTAAFTAEL